MKVNKKSNKIQEEEQMNAPLTKDELKELKKELQKEFREQIPEATGAITPMSLLDLVPTKAGSILGTKILRFFKETLSKTRPKFFRGVGEGGFDDAIESGVFRNKPMDPDRIVPEGTFDLSKTGSFGDLVYVSPKLEEVAKRYGMTSKTKSGYPSYVAEFDDLLSAKKLYPKKGDLKGPTRGWSKAFKGDLPIEESTARIIKYSGPEDKVGTTVADFRKPLVGKTPTPTTPVTTDSKSKKKKQKKKLNYPMGRKI